MLLSAAALTLMMVASPVEMHPPGAEPMALAAPCRTAEQRLQDQALVELRRRQLTEDGRLSPPSPGVAVAFVWPLRTLVGNDPGHHALTNFVDQDPTFPGAILDYQCGRRSYDSTTGYNHQGTDYLLWPYSWYQMDRDTVAVVAVADGTILVRQDGQPDRSCGPTGTWNAIYVQHHDGSGAWYGHFKRGSLTAKGHGDTVVAGEYLGLVGSSGASFAPHLHLEIYDAAGNLIDPYDGPCNSLNATSWWQGQRPYFDTAINKLATHFAVPVFPPCPQAERPAFAGTFAPGDTLYLSVYFRDLTAGQRADLVLRRPDGTIAQEWSYTETASHRATRSRFWSWTLPSAGPLGEWRFEATLDGQLATHSLHLAQRVFGDGFESGDIGSWTAVGGE